MATPDQKDRKLRRMRHTHDIVEKRKAIIRNSWKEDPEECFPNGMCNGRLRKYNLRCDCRTCKRSKSRAKDKGWRKANNMFMRGFNL